jgi:hypothetical protein
MIRRAVQDGHGGMTYSLVFCMLKEEITTFVWLQDILRFPSPHLCFNVVSTFD